MKSTDNYLIEKYDIEENYWVTLHVLLEFEFNFLHHKVLFNLSTNYAGDE